MRKRTGFTLLEVLIASALLSTLMLLVWSLFNSFTRLEQRSSRAAVELQLTRSITSQLRSDVEHLAIPTTWPTSDRDLGGKSPDDGEQGSEQDAELAGEPSGTETSPSSETSSRETITEDALETTQLELDSGQLAGDVQPSVRLDFGDLPSLDNIQPNQTPVFDASLLETMYFRGSATKLELVIRQPYTVDVPTGDQLIGADSRYGTHQYIIWEWKSPRDLGTLLRGDPVLNPKNFVPPTPTTPIPNAPGIPGMPGTPPLPTSIQPTVPQPLPPQTATRLNPNENVGLIRESKSWLHLTRDKRREALRHQAEQSGMLVNGRFPWELQPMQSPLLQPNPLQQPGQFGGSLNSDSMLSPWTPPPEFRHKRDHLPEVTQLQFRYSNGKDWQLDWQSDSELPKAIEVAFDLDPDAPAVRAKEFEQAHSAVLGGATVEEVLPREEELLEDTLPGMDELLQSNLVDPTAIVTEYRFVIRLPETRIAEESSFEVEALQPDASSLLLEDER